MTKCRKSSPLKSQKNVPSISSHSRSLPTSSPTPRLHNLQRESDGDWLSLATCVWQGSACSVPALRAVTFLLCGRSQLRESSIYCKPGRHMWRSNHVQVGRSSQTTSYRIPTRRGSAQIMQETHMIRSFQSSFFFLLLFFSTLERFWIVIKRGATGVFALLEGQKLQHSV